MKEFFKKFGVYIVAAIVFVAVACIYCFPVLQGKVIYAGDNFNAECASHETMEYARTTGDHSWWTGSMFCGMPDYQIGGGQYKTDTLLSPLTSFFHLGHSHTIWVFIIYFICFFALLRSFDVEKWLSIAGALAIAFSSYFIVIIAAGHNGKTSTIALISVVFAGFYLIFRKKYALGAIFAMVFTAIGFRTHPQMAYYIFMMIGLCWFGELYTHIKEKRMKDFAVATLLFFASVGLGMGTSTANVFANAEYTRETMRGGHSDLAKGDEADNSNGLSLEYATQWSYGRSETFSLLIPGFMGGASTMDIGKDSEIYKTMISKGVAPQAARSFVEDAPLYWGDQPFTAGNVYVGAIVCFLFILGLLIVKGPYKWTLLLATLFSIFLAWGHNWLGFTEFFFKYFPLYNKFRAVSSILIVAEIAMPLLGFLALREIIKEGADRKKLLGKVAISGGITAGICLFFALFGPSLFDFKSIFDARLQAQMPDWLYSSLLDERASMLVRDSWRSFFFVVAGVAVVLLRLWGKLGNVAFAAILGVLMMLDLWPVDRRYLNESNFVPAYQQSRYYAETPWEKTILGDKDPHFRVLNLAANTFNDARTSYRLKSIGGYSAAKLRRYQDLIDVYMGQEVYPAIISMLNAKYIINYDDKGNEIVQMNPYAQGNAWFVDRIRLVDTPDEEMSALSEIDLRSEAVVDRQFASFVPKTEIKGDPDAVVMLTSYSPKQLDYKCVTQEPTTLIFSEIYYPYGWKAFIDGKLTPHFRANYLLRALNVPAGSHEITFLFDPDSVKKGDRIALACVILMYLIVLGIAGTAVYKRLKRKNA